MEKIRVELTEINEKLDVIIGIMERPENKVIKTLETVVLVIGVFGLVGIVDIIRQWIIGG